VTRADGSDGAISVQYASSDGSATAGSDYTAGNGTLNWADGDADTKTFTVAILDDSDEEADETITLTLTSPGGGAALGNPAVAELTIVDDDTDEVPGVKSFSGATQTGSGIQVVSFTGGGDACGFVAPDTTLVAAPVPLPSGGYVFPHGVFASRIENCVAGAALTFTVTYPQALPAGVVFWKYGATPADPAPHWYPFPATISGDTVSYTLIDGGPGDDDLRADGTIVDPSGPGIPDGTIIPGEPAVPLPLLGDRARTLMLLLLGLFGALALRRQHLH
jgi:hypothetical protein